MHVCGHRRDDGRHSHPGNEQQQAGVILHWNWTVEVTSAVSRGSALGMVLKPGLNLHTVWTLADCKDVNLASSLVKIASSWRVSSMQVAVSNLDLVLLEARSTFDQLSPHLLATLECLYKAVLAFAEDIVPCHGRTAEAWESRWHAARPSASAMSCGELSAGWASHLDMCGCMSTGGRCHGHCWP